MENLTLLKIKLSVLWIINAVAMYRCTFFIDPGILEKTLAGDLAFMQTPGRALNYHTYVADSLIHGFPGPDLKGFDKSLDKHHPGHSLYWS